uniref:3-hydroxyisobutyryl-CoA hydrolase n=1 Tax=Araucaria cunninghamii TaxID=56994 RepID=A0A0D6R0P1_ARACU
MQGPLFFLSHLPGFLGEYLALTGERLNGAEMLATGLATHFSVSARINWIEERLGSLVTDDPSVVKTALDEYSDVVIPDTKSFIRRVDSIDSCFSKESIEEILCALETEAAGENDEWYAKTIGKLKEASPLSLKISLRSIRESRFQSLDQCLAREYRITCHALSKRISGDFYEGIRARLIDKDSSPKWNPPCLEQVSREMVDQYFLPLEEDVQDLELPVKQREAYI